MIAFVPDLHLRYRLFNYLPQLVGDSYISLKAITAAIIEREAKAVIFGGDIFDAVPDPLTVQTFMDEMRRLRGCRIERYAIQGQHAKTALLPWHELEGFVQDLDDWTGGDKKSKALETGPFVIAGTGAKGPDELKAWLDGVDPRVNVLALHQTVRGAMPEILGQCGWDLEPAWVKPSVRLVLLGHIHKTLEIRHKETLFAYGGSTVLCAIDEQPDKSFILVHDDFKVERVPIPTRPLLRLVVDGPENMPVATEAVKQAREGTLAVVRYNPTVPDVEKTLRAANASCVFTFRVAMPESSAARTVLATTGASLESCLGQLVDREKEPRLYDALLVELTSQNPKETLAEVRKRILG